MDNDVEETKEEGKYERRETYKELEPKESERKELLKYSIERKQVGPSPKLQLASYRLPTSPSPVLLFPTLYP